jgi:hypothetical protein
VEAAGTELAVVDELDAEDGEFPFPGLAFKVAVEPVPEVVGVAVELDVEGETPVGVDEEDEDAFGSGVTTVSEPGIAFVAGVCEVPFGTGPAVVAVVAPVPDVPGVADAVA